MTRWRRTTACERAAQWISLDLDRELGALDRAALARHLGRCEHCRELSADFVTVTGLIRTAPLVQAARPVEVIVPDWARGRVRATFQAALVAFALAAAIFAGVTALSGSHTPAGVITAGPGDALRVMAVEHARIEPTVFLIAPDASAPSFAGRALL